MKCTDRIKLIAILSLVCCISLSGCSTIKNTMITDYETENYAHKLFEDHLYAEDLCVSVEDVSLPDYSVNPSLHAAGLFNLDSKEISYSYQIHEKLYPASVTKILTALVAMNNCDLDSVVTVSSTAAASSFAFDEQVCGLQEGDKLTLRALLNGMLLYSGNDNATAIAEYIGGSIENFANMMNAQAKALCANNSNFITPNGLHNEDHYTTAYDLYLIFNECIKHQDFLDIISASSYVADITDAAGNVRQVVWEPTSYYAQGLAALPASATVIGGKTGYTGDAGNCLIVLDQDPDGKYFVSIVMGAETKEDLYSDMTSVIEQIPKVE